MPTVLDILAIKGKDVYTIPAYATVLEATIVMNERRIGCLMVMDDDQLVGIFTERDVLRRVVARDLPAAIIRVEQVMTRQVICCPPTMDLDEASQIMRDQRIRHLPVCGSKGQLLGIISIGDLNAYHASNQEAQINFLHDYVFGRV
ncbi:MAG TPA: CBS domain-containing protein [Tepidisphaeraceae bacterium]|nr:CBS domain-containing protein [Tepidisphaeraceae bacterium]